MSSHPRSTYELPDIRLEADEAAVLGLAARVWQQRASPETASAALLKLRAAGVETHDVSMLGIEPRVNASEAAFGPLWEACATSASDVRLSGGRCREQVRRHLEPWGIVSWHGRWYVTGHDRDRGAVRSFRLGRVVGDVGPDGDVGTVTVPADVDVRALVAHAYAGEPSPRRPCADPCRGRVPAAAPGAIDHERRDGVGSDRSPLRGHRVARGVPGVLRCGRGGHRSSGAARRRAPAASRRCGGAGAGMTARAGNPHLAHAGAGALPAVPPRIAPGRRGADVRVTEKRLRDDLDLLFMCGLPGHLPDDLIEVSLEG